MDEARLRSKLANLNHINEEIASHEKILEEAARKSAHWEGASNEVMRTLRGLFAEIGTVLPRKNIAFNDSNNIDGLRSQLSSARRKVKEGIKSLSSSGFEAAKPEPKLDSESIHVVFISSTFDDLREERAEVQKAVLRLGCLPIGMELFPSADDDAWNYIKGEIERCDYYVLIVGGRYGSVDTNGVSFTEKEYRLARSLKKPCLVFVRSTKALVTPDKFEQDNAKKTRLEEFVAELNKSRLAQRFDNHYQLGGEAYFSLNKLRKKHPTQAYIRDAANTSDSELVTLRTQYETLLAEHQSLLETSVERPPITPPSPAEKLGMSRYEHPVPRAEVKAPPILPEIDKESEALLDIRPFYAGRSWRPQPNNVFVAMPFDPQYEEFYRQCIEEAIEGCGLHAVRIDKTKIPDPNVPIMDLVKSNIATCRFVVADVTGFRANVVYEVGLAHAVGKRVLFMCEDKYRDERGLLFDISQYLHLFYSPYKIKTFGDELRASIRHMKDHTG